MYRSYKKCTVSAENRDGMTVFSGIAVKVCRELIFVIRCGFFSVFPVVNFGIIFGLRRQVALVHAGLVATGCLVEERKRARAVAAFDAPRHSGVKRISVDRLLHKIKF